MVCDAALACAMARAAKTRHRRGGRASEREERKYTSDSTNKTVPASYRAYLQIADGLQDGESGNRRLVAQRDLGAGKRLQAGTGRVAVGHPGGDLAGQAHQRDGKASLAKRAVAAVVLCAIGSGIRMGMCIRNDHHGSVEEVSFEVAVDMGNDVAAFDSGEGVFRITPFSNNPIAFGA